MEHKDYAYEIKDTQNPKARGQRFANLNRAIVELSRAVGDPGRWIIVDRETGTVVRTNRGSQT